jgi:aspartyl-tRNA(Asn)/glutamyl-tRNA(Gln) amidotransferase subunit A
MAPLSSLLNIPISTLRIQYLTGETSVTAVAQTLAARIESVNPEINCFINFDPEIILSAARQLDSLPLEARQQLPLFGIPVSVKDMILTIDQPTTAGSAILKNFRSPYDATVVKRLRAAGALITGKTNLDEFAMGASSETSHFGATKNPWDIEYVPGGSSGGSAASVAGLMSLASLGTDTGGSVRQPASFCNLVGIKPTYGRLSRYGVIAYASSLDQVGVFGRSVTETELIYDLIEGHDPLDSTSIRAEPIIKKIEIGKSGAPLHNLRIGLPREYFVSGVSSEVAKVVTESAEILKGLGASLVDITLPHTELAVPTYYIIAPAEASSNLSRYDGIKYGHRSSSGKDLNELYCNSRSEGFGLETRRRIIIGSYVLSSGYYDAFYRKALKVRRLIQNDFLAAFSTKCDLILSPVSPTPPYKIGEKIADPLTMYLGDIFTAPVNLAGLPALAIPGGFTEKRKLPIGIQLIGSPWQEKLLFNVGRHFQETTDWHTVVAPDLPLFSN